MVRSLLLTIGLVFTAVLAMAQTRLAGKVDDPLGPTAGATVKVLKGETFVTGASTDFDGNFSMTMDPGTYNVEFSYVGYGTERVTGVIVYAGKTNFLNKSFSDDQATATTGVVVVTAYKVPLIQQDNTEQGKTVTAEEIRNLPTKSVSAIVATTAGTSSVDGGAVTIRGSRDNATNYYIDGVRVNSKALPPVQDIDQLQVVTGGLGAQYGDVTGGVVSVYTKGPASKYSGGIELETSQFLDAFGYNQINANISGPIVKRKNSTQSLIGFRLSGTYTGQKDDDPSALPIAVVTDAKKRELEAKPVQKQGFAVINSGEFLTADDVYASKINPDEEQQSLSVTGKLDFRLSSAIDASLTGTFTGSRDKFTPDDGGNAWLGNWHLLNSQYNPTEDENRYRGIFRFRHRLSQPAEEGEKVTKTGLISNAQYTLALGYEQGTRFRQDSRHKDRLFDYGYVGRYDYEWTPTFGPHPWRPGELIHTDYLQNFVSYQGGTINPTIAAFNEYATLGETPNFIQLNGRTITGYGNLWNGLHENIGTVYNSYFKEANDIYTANATVSFDLTPGGSKKGRHAIEFGLMYEQRVERNYNFGPYGLWDAARLQANDRHIIGVDTNNIINVIVEQGPFGPDSVDIYGNKTVDIPDIKFYKKIREALGVGIGDYVNVDALTPDQLSLSMFSPKELTDPEYLDYQGFDYLGNKLANTVTFNDFFTKTDGDGIRTFPVAPNSPVYQAAYLQDKFQFRDIIFRVGLRVDRYDANTKVMKDPYSLYEVMQASEFYSTVGRPQPANVSNDWKVYVSEEDDKTITGYRSGDQWYNSQGTAVNDGNVLFGSGVVTPRLKYPGSSIKDQGFDPNQSFTDYTPQVNWMPRLAFSFPISTDANFFAHYDILVQRPPSDAYVSPLDYYYFYDAGRTTRNNSNAALKPEKTIDYEVGFAQKLNNNSALTLSAYYKELRDMVQRRTYGFIPTIVSYETFGNIDFATVKGFNVKYDMRRIQNAQLGIAYTLQFADGTGSDANSQRGISQRGNIRTLFPVTFDERHNVQAVIDYRFDRGKKYTGPRINGKDFLAEFGANLLVSAVSGRPYTAKDRSTRFDGAGNKGALNGARLPWRFNVDLRLDKNFNLSKKESSPLALNVYFRVANIVNIKNVVRVYGATGSPVDDGYRETPDGRAELQSVLESGKSVQSFNQSYQWAMLNPDYYGLPRRIFMGAIFNF